MNEEKKAVPPQTTPPQPVSQQTVMQDAIQQMLPDNLKTEIAVEKSKEVQIPSTPVSPAISSIPSTALKLDPNLAQKPIRTYESDLAEALKRKQGSTASMSIAESERKEQMSRNAEMVKKMSERGTNPPQVERAPLPPLVPTSPSHATAMPAGPITIAPNVPKSEVGAEIADALRIAHPEMEKARQAALLKQAAQVQAVVNVPSPTPLVSAINVPTNVTFVSPRPSLVKPALLTIASLILISGGIFAGYFLFARFESTKEIPIVTPITIQSIIPHDGQKAIAVDGQTGEQILTTIYAEIGRATVAPGKNWELLLNEGVTSLSASQFIDKLETNMPAVIKRSLIDRFMLGIYGEKEGQKTTFVALSTDFFQNAFAGMLMWEEDALADDLALLLNFKNKARRDDFSTTTASEYFNIRGTYSDRIIKNRDVREFRSPDGQLLFLYSFINKETLLLTTTESAFIALVERIEKDAYVR